MSNPVRSATHLTARDASLLQRLLDQARHGETRVALVSGGVGAGKTSFLATAARRAREEGFAVGSLSPGHILLADDESCASHPAEQQPTPLADVLRAARLDAQRSLLSIDDAHLWEADEIAATIREIRAARTGVVLLLTAPEAREESDRARVARLNAALTSEHDVVVHALTPWSGEDIHEVTPEGPEWPPSIRFGYELARITGGNPALVRAYLELIGQLDAGDRRAFLTGTRRLIDLPPPDEATRIVEARTGFISGTSRRVLQTLALFGLRAEASTIAALADLHEREVEHALDELEDAGQVRVIRDGPVTRFALPDQVTGRVLALGAPSLLADRVHSGASAVLLGHRDLTPRQNITRAIHHTAHRPLSNESAEEVLDAASVLLARGRHLSAQDLALIVLADALEADLSAATLIGAAQTLAETLNRSGEDRVAERLVEATRPRSDSDQPAYLRALLKVAQAWIGGGRELEAEAVLRRVIAHPHSPADVQVVATTELVRLHHWNGDPKRAISLASDARTHHAGDGAALAQLWLHQALVSDMGGHPEDARAEAWSAVVLARGQDESVFVRALGIVGETWLDTDTSSRAVRWLRGAVRRAEQHQQVADAAWIRNRLVPAYVEAGDWPIAILTAQRGMGLAASINLRHTTRRTQAGVALVEALQGHPSSTWLRTRITATDFGNPLVLVAVAAALFEQQRVAGQLEHAHQTAVLTAEALSARPGWERLLAMEVLPRLALSAYEHRDEAILARVVDQLRSILESRPAFTVARAELGMAEARFALLAGDSADAVASIEAALAGFAGHRYRWRGAVAGGLAAQVFAASGERARAVATLRTRIPVLDAMGAAPAAAQLRTQLHVLGAGSPRTPRAPDALTPRQAEVARLAAAGLSDREIATELGISWRTTTTHMHAILSRLGVRSRAELAERLTGQD